MCLLLEFQYIGLQLLLFFVVILNMILKLTCLVSWRNICHLCMYT